jgi:hypothetical protein
MKNCFDCVFKDIVFTNLMSFSEKKNFDPSQYVMIEENRHHMGDYMGRCKKGFNDKLLAFHKEHGHSYRKDLEARTDLDMDCHDYSEGVKKLDSMLDSTNKLLEMLTNKKPSQ